MNRLQFKPAHKAPPLERYAPLCAGGTFASGGGDAPFAQFAPLHYEPNYAYPLLVWLHGAGDSEHQLRRIMPHVSMRNYVAIAPRGTIVITPPDADQKAYAWSQSSGDIGQAEHCISRAISAAKRRYHIRPDRVFLAGYDCGGTMAFRVALHDALSFAGVISLCGPFPRQGAPLADLDRVRSLPLFVSACRAATRYPTDQVCDDLRLLHSAGMSITLKEYPGADGLSADMLADVDRWIMEQISTTQRQAIPQPKQSGVG
jgi:phospholipase/carboxylesterase